MIKTIIAMLAIGLVATSCGKMGMNDASISPEQIAAAGEITLAFNSAGIYNDSLKGTYSDPQQYPMTMRVYYDQQFHKQVARFDSCHHRFHHTLQAANHQHDNTRKAVMHNSSASSMGGHCNCCNNGGHDAGIHNTMADLMNRHSAYHPQ